MEDGFIRQKDVYKRQGYVLVPDEVYDKAELYAAVCGAGRALGYVCAPSLFQKMIVKCQGATGDINARCV